MKAIAPKYSSPEADWQRLKTRAAYAGLGLAAVALALVGYKYSKAAIQEIQQGNTESSTTTAGSSAYFAARLIAAFDRTGFEIWDGTDEELAFQVAREIPSAAVYKDVMRDYQRLTGKNLNEVAREELTSVFGNEDYDTWLAILNSKK